MDKKDIEKMSYHERLMQYEKEKKALGFIDPEEYEKKIREIVDRLGI